jgi:two-component system, NtrC family, sensor kinase
VITLRDTEVRLFTDRQVTLLQTFADQAVIAIENVRLFNEGKEALEQQTATSEILRVMSSSPTSLQPVLDAVAQNAARVCEGQDATVLLVEGTLLRHVANNTGGISVTPGDVYALRRDTIMGRAVIDRRTIHVEDLLVLAGEYPEGARLAAELGHRTTLATPLLREGEAIGVLLIRRLEIRPFTDTQITLLRTFADQAVIAIENVRLFKELETRNRDLTEALDRQTGTAAILRVISEAQTDAEPVFNAIADNAQQLFRAWSAGVYRFDDNLLHLLAMRGGLAGSVEYMQGQSPWPIHERPVAARVFRSQTIVHVADVESDPTMDPMPSTSHAGAGSAPSSPLRCYATGNLSE